MFRPSIAVLVFFAIIKVSLDFITGSPASGDLSLLKMSGLSSHILTEIPGTAAPLVGLFPILPLLLLILLFAWGLLSLLEVDS